MLWQSIKSTFFETLWYQITLVTILLFSFSIYFFLDKSAIILVGEEDGFFEYLTASLFFVSSVLMLRLALKRNRFFFLFFLLLFIGAGEEISWGQRILQLDTPDSIKKMNVQGELTIHNLEFVNRENFNQTVKSGWRKALTINGLYRIFIFTYGFGLPFLILFSKKIKSIITVLKLPFPPAFIGFHFILAWLFFKYFNAEFPPVLHENTAEEIFETMTAWVWLCIGLYFIKSSNNETIVTDRNNKMNS